MWSAFPPPCWSTSRRRALRCVLLASALSVGATLVLADDNDDHERAFRAVNEGKVVPLRGLLQTFERQYRGKVLKVEFEEDDGAYRYEVRLVRAQGEVLELEVDAVTGRVLKQEVDD